MGRKRGKVSHAIFDRSLNVIRMFIFADFVFHRIEEAPASEYASNADFRVTPGNSSTRCESEAYSDLKWFRRCYSQ
jgi:hypothetical protein